MCSTPAHSIISARTMLLQLSLVSGLVCPQHAWAKSYVLIAQTDEGCLLYIDGTDLVSEGCNVHIRNGDGQTDSINSLGNLVVGYDENSGQDKKNGSHNLIIGLSLIHI